VCSPRGGGEGPGTAGCVGGDFEGVGPRLGPGNHRRGGVEQDAARVEEVFRAGGAIDLPTVGERTRQAMDANVPVIAGAILAAVEKQDIEKALEHTGGVKKRAAEVLGITFRSIRYRLAKLGMGDEDESHSD